MLNDHPRHDTERDAQEAEIVAAGELLDNALLDAINAQPPEERGDWCQRVRERMAAAPGYVIVDRVD